MKRVILKVLKWMALPTFIVVCFGLVAFDISNKHNGGTTSSELKLMDKPYQ